MHIRLRDWFAIAGVLLCGLVAFATESDQDLSAEVLDQFQLIRNEMKNALQVQPDCQGYSNLSGKAPPRCNFAGFCSLLDKNANSTSIYADPQGRKVPNFQLYWVDEKLKACSDVRDRSQFMRDSITGKLEDQRKKRKIRVLETERRFWEILIKKGESEKFSRILEANLDKSVQDIDHAMESDGLPIPLRSREEIAAELSGLELRAKLNPPLSPESRQAYIDSQIAQIEAIYGSEDEKADSEKDKPGRWKIMNDDPFLNLSRFYSVKEAGGKKQVLENQERYQVELDRSFRIFNKTKSAIVALLKKRQTPSNQKQIENMIRRIETIKMNPVNLDPTMNPSFEGRTIGPCPGPNAFYNAQSHSFTVCPQIMELPEAGLKSIIAHELGHSIDPCTLSGPLYSIQGERKFDPIKEISERQGELEKQGMYFYVPKLPENVPETDYGVDIFHEGVSEGAKLYYKSPTIKRVTKGVPYKEHPLKGVVECLKSNASVSARGPSEAELRRTLQDAIAKKRETGANAQNSPHLRRLQESLKNVKQVMDEQGGCSFIPTESGESQLQEAFSDWVATEVIASDIANAPAARAADTVFGSMTFFLGVECPMAYRLQESASQLATKMGCEAQGGFSDLISIWNAMGRKQDAHPFSQDRINRLFMAQPAIAKALGCSQSTSARGKYCE